MHARTCLALPCHLENLTYSKEQWSFIYQKKSYDVLFLFTWYGHIYYAVMKVFMEKTSIKGHSYTR